MFKTELQQNLLTTDKQILRKMKSDNRIQILDPVDFIREMEAVDE
jgi:predicted nucleic acid-binding protein